MPLRDLIPKRRFVDVGGRRYLCRPPAWSTVRLVLELYPAEILALAKGFRGIERRPKVQEVLPLFVDRRMAAILPTCVEIVGGRPGDLEECVSSDPGLASILCGEVLRLCDPERIVRSLNLDAAVDEILERKAPEDGAAAPDPVHALGACVLAKTFSVPPHEVLGWPYEEILELAEAVPYLLEPRPSEHRTQEDGIDASSMSAEVLNAMNRVH